MSQVEAHAAREPKPGRKEVAAYLGMTESGLAQLHYRKQGPPQYRLGRKILYSWESVDSWLESRKVEGNA